MSDPAQSPAYLQSLAAQAATNNGIDPRIFLAQIMAESGFNPNVVSPAGAIGIAQIMPATAKGWGVNPYNPVDSLNAAAANMKKYLDKYGSYPLALAAYNAGPGAVDKYGGVPPYHETQNYVSTIMGSAGTSDSSATPLPVGAQSWIDRLLHGVGLPNSTDVKIAQDAMKGDGKAIAGPFGLPNLQSIGIIALGLVLVALGGNWLITRSASGAGSIPQIAAAKRTGKKTATAIGGIAKVAALVVK